MQRDPSRRPQHHVHGCPNSCRWASPAPTPLGFSRRCPHPHSGATPPAAVNLPLSTYCLRSASQQEVLCPGTVRPPQLRLAINGSPDTTHAAQLASGFPNALDWQPDIAPDPDVFLPTVSPATQEATAVPTAPIAPAASD